MYSDPFSIYREYVQNATDSIDNALKEGILNDGEGRIDITVDPQKSIIAIKDNGTGIPIDKAYKILGDIGNSSKDYRLNRGFRGIGRLGGLGYAKKLTFRTKFKGDLQQISITWDCSKLKRLLEPGKFLDYDLIKVITEVTSTNTSPALKNEHFFEITLYDVDPMTPELLDVNLVNSYLSAVAPVPFDFQTFFEGKKIKKQLLQLGLPLEEYSVHLNGNAKPIRKKYSSSFRTGHQERSKQRDSIKDIEFFEYKNQNGYVYIGWLALTNFYGLVSDEFMVGVRIRKGNILIGSKDNFTQFFPSEKEVANRSFIGEVYIFDKDIIPNARRDDFEKNQNFQQLFTELSKKADFFNKKYRRESSRYNSAVKRIDESKKELVEIISEIENGGITSDTKKDILIERKEAIEKCIDVNKKELSKIIDHQDLDEDKKKKAELYVKTADSLQEQIVEVENKIVNADYATKKDLPTSYSKEERRIYQIIIKVIDENVDADTAKMLRTKIREELSIVKKKGTRN
jgi:molecular chaperone HtpG